MIFSLDPGIMRFFVLFNIAIPLGHHGQIYRSTPSGSLILEGTCLECFNSSVTSLERLKSHKKFVFSRLKLVK